jgi:hypothetical protein
VARSATFLFAAGQETTTKLLSASMKVLGDHPDVLATLRKDRSRIPVFVEEALRIPRKEPVPARQKEHHPRRHGRARGHHVDGVPGRGQP